MVTLQDISRNFCLANDLTENGEVILMDPRGKSWNMPCCCLYCRCRGYTENYYVIFIFFQTHKQGDKRVVLFYIELTNKG